MITISWRVWFIVFFRLFEGVANDLLDFKLLLTKKLTLKISWNLLAFPHTRLYFIPTKVCILSIFIFYWNIIMHDCLTMPDKAWQCMTMHDFNSSFRILWIPLQNKRYQTIYWTWNDGQSAPPSWRRGRHIPEITIFY